MSGNSDRYLVDWRRSLMFGACAFAIATSAWAQVDGPSAPLRLSSDYFGWGASVSPRVGYSDNINLLPDGLEDGAVILSNQFTGSAIVSSPRFTGIVSGDLDLSYFTNDGGDFVVNQRIGGASTTTFVEDWLFLDLSGSTSRQLLGDNARFSGNINAARGQQANVHNYAVSPYVHRKLPNDAVAELRYRFSQVFIDDDDTDANPTAGGLLNDSRSQEISADYQSGLLFDRLRFVASAYGNRTVEDGSFIAPRLEYEQGTLQTSAQFALTDRFSLTGALGYDDIQTETEGALDLFDDDALSGLFWRAGFAARPGRKTSLRLEYGRRFGDDFVDADLEYQLSKRFIFSAGASRTFQTRAQSVSSRFSNLQQETLEFADRLRQTSEGLSARQVVEAANRTAQTGIGAQTIGIGTFNNAFGRLRGVWDRTEISASGTYEDSDFGFRTVTTFGGDLSVRRRLSRRLSAYASAFYRHAETDFDPATCETSPFLFGFDATQLAFDPVTACAQFAEQNGRTDTIGGRIGGQYRVYENLSAFAEYSRTHRLAESDLLRYKENALLAGVTLDF